MLDDVDDAVINAGLSKNADFKRVVTGEIFPVYTRIFPVARGLPIKMGAVSSSLSNHIQTWQKHLTQILL